MTKEFEERMNKSFKDVLAITEMSDRYIQLTDVSVKNAKDILFSTMLDFKSILMDNEVPYKTVDIADIIFKMSNTLSAGKILAIEKILLEATLDLVKMTRPPFRHPVEHSSTGIPEIDALKNIDPSKIDFKNMKGDTDGD